MTLCINKVEKQKTKNISCSGQKEWLELCAIIFRDGVEKMTGNASCFVTLFHEHN